jgi:hypothetical protein
MNINFNVNLEKIKQKQLQKAKTGLSMQNTVTNALNLPVNNPTQPMPEMSNSQGWGANAQ